MVVLEYDSDEIEEIIIGNSPENNGISTGEREFVFSRATSVSESMYVVEMVGACNFCVKGKF